MENPDSNNTTKHFVPMIAGYINGRKFYGGHFWTRAHAVQLLVIKK